MKDELKRLEGLVGKQVDAYHDGKASPGRLVRVVIDEVGTRDDLTKRERGIWHRALKADFKEAFDGICRYTLKDGSTTKQFWDWNCTTFMSGHILYDDETIRDRMLFAKLSGGQGWYCVNWNYMLDINGRIRRRHAASWRQGAKERGLRMIWSADAGKYHYFHINTGCLARDM